MDDVNFCTLLTNKFRQLFPLRFVVIESAVQFIPEMLFRGWGLGWRWPCVSPYSSRSAAELENECLILHKVKRMRCTADPLEEFSTQ